ncbi:uncharacterized protein PG986_007223 [Apiospora aurea]|uniref:Uncharacterized protein n=1 Tax=Apiospora aurea TaxID=335848 RepID=A0ABR1QDB5_9PEZI
MTTRRTVEVEGQTQPSALDEDGSELNGNCKLLFLSGNTILLCCFQLGRPAVAATKRGGLPSICIISIHIFVILLRQKCAFTEIDALFQCLWGAHTCDILMLGDVVVFSVGTHVRRGGKVKPDYRHVMRLCLTALGLILFALGIRERDDRVIVIGFELVVGI